MNERITELFKLAGGKTSIHNLMSNPMQQREHSELWNENIQKFAELIVRECAEIARLNTREDSKVYLMIQEHFGVEECGTKN